MSIRLKTSGGISYRTRNATVDGEPRYLSRANNGFKDNGTWAPAEALVKDATMGWTSQQQKSVALSDLKLQSGKVFSVDIYNHNGLDYGVSNTFLHSKSALTKDGIDITNGLDYLGQAVLAFNFGI